MNELYTTLFKKVKEDIDKHPYDKLSKPLIKEVIDELIIINLKDMIVNFNLTRIDMHQGLEAVKKDLKEYIDYSDRSEGSIKYLQVVETNG